MSIGNQDIFYRIIFCGIFSLLACNLQSKYYWTVHSFGALYKTHLYSNYSIQNTAISSFDRTMALTVSVSQYLHSPLTTFTDITYLLIMLFTSVPRFSVQQSLA